MTTEASPVEDSIRTMREDLKKARRGSRPVPQVRKRDLQSKNRLEEIISHADGGGSSVLEDLRSSKQSLGHSPTGEATAPKPLENLDDLLPLEDTQASDADPHTLVLPNTPPKSPQDKPVGEVSLPAVRQGSPPPNLPRGPLSPTKQSAKPPEDVESIQNQDEPVSTPLRTQMTAPEGLAHRTTAEGLEEHEKPSETPEELLNISAPTIPKSSPAVQATPKKIGGAPAGESEVSLPVSPKIEGLGGQDVAESRRPWKFIAILVALITLGSVSGFLIWNFLITTEEPPAPTPPPVEEPVIEAPSALIPTNIELVIQSAEEIRSLEFLSISPEQIVHIPYYLENVKRFASPEDFFTALSIQAPPPFFRLISNALTPYLYIPGNEERERCSQENIADTSCFSPRLGMIFHVSPENIDLVRGVMEDWENTMSTDILPLVFGDPSLPTTGFSSVTYRDIAVRFVNLPISTTAINYALTDSFVVIATSKNSLYTVLDTIIEITSE